MADIDEIKGKIDIVEYINARVPLKRAGRNYRALCPFHQEKTPSFFVNPERQIWYCFGTCDQGGDVISFLQKWENLEFIEALRILADEAGVKLIFAGLGSDNTQKKQQLYEINHLATEFYHYLLTQHSVGKIAQDYLKHRKIRDKTIKTFMLGYAPQSWNSLLQFLQRKNYTAQVAEQAGLVIYSAKANKYYDRFRGRIVFPIKDHLGNIVGFSGRTLIEDVKEAKYINTPETLIYRKRETLYGLAITAKALRREKTAIVVEGEFDLLSSFQLGVTNVVAIKGSGLTDGQLKLLQRYADRLIFALDTDHAGEEAVKRGLLAAEEAGMPVEVAVLKGGKDPDELIHNEPVTWREIIKKPVNYLDYVIGTNVRKFGVETPQAKRQIISELAGFFIYVTNPIIRAHYAKKIAQQLALTEDVVSQALDEGARTIKLGYPATRIAARQLLKDKSIGEKPRWQRIEEHLLSLVLQSSDVKQYLQSLEAILELEQMPQHAARSVLLQLRKWLSTVKSVSLPNFFAALEKELLTVADKAYIHELNIQDELQRKHELITAARELQLIILRKQRNKAIEKVKELEATAKEDKKLAVLQRDINILSRRIYQLQRNAS